MALFLLQTSYIFALSFINKWIYSRLTYQKFVWHSYYLCDLFTYFACGLSMQMHSRLLTVQNDGYFLEEKPSREVMYVADFFDT